MSASRDGIRKSPGFDVVMRRVAEDLAAREAANPVPPEERIARAFERAPVELRGARRMLADAAAWFSRRREVSP